MDHQVNRRGFMGAAIGTGAAAGLGALSPAALGKPANVAKPYKGRLAKDDISIQLYTLRSTTWSSTTIRRCRTPTTPRPRSRRRARASST